MELAAIRAWIAQMTLEEKASLCSGEDFWHTKAVERLGIPAMMMSDGPHGLRKQDLEADHLGVNESIRAVCFPAGCATAASFDRDLLRFMGEALGKECQAEGVGVILGPAVNIKRSPLCGRNFEYYSEDPLVATELAGAFIDGVQSQNVGTSLKHFLANNQEHRRLSSSSEVDERTLREIYLAAFEGAVKEHKPWTVMCSYNRINGVYAAEHKTYLTDVLRDEWGFDGYVVSDWGAVNDRPADLAAGCDLEMPSSGGTNDAILADAVLAGKVEEAALDLACERILSIVFRAVENRRKGEVFDRDADHLLAAKVAEESMVLLKNEGVLPLAKTKKVAFIGQYAKKPRYQGGGSSHINSHKVTSAWEAACEAGLSVTYAQGFDDARGADDAALLAEAKEAAAQAEVAVVFAGLPESYESEGYDRTHMRMPEWQNELIRQVAGVQPNTVVVLHNGSPVEMPWVDDVAAIVEAYLGGQAVGMACVKVLYGDVNPSGKLAESFPKRLEDNPSYLYYFGEGDKVEYREGVFVGYRYYDTKKMDVLFPFGHGLSYTTFAYDNLRLSAETIRDTETLTVSVDVTNTGAVYGKEIVQLYVHDRESTVLRPEKELREFAKIGLEPGETKTVTFALTKRAFAYWNTTLHDWHVESGVFDILIGRSSRDLALSAAVTVESTVQIPVTYTVNTTIADVLADPVAAKIVQPLLAAGAQEPEEEGSAGAESMSEEMARAMFGYSPLRTFVSFGGAGKVSMTDVQNVADAMNEATRKA